MATVYTDALYSSTNLGVPSSSYFSLSSSGNELVLAIPGTFDGVDVVGVAYNLADWAESDTAAERVTLTIDSFSSGESAGDSTTLTAGVSSVPGLTFALILADRRYITLTYSGATSAAEFTYAADLSAATTDVSDPNTRRMFMLGFI